MVRVARGGARNRSGPQPDPESGRSDARGLSFDALPAEGFDGDIPDFPLPPRVVKEWEYDGDKKSRVVDQDATDAVAEREREVWEWAWRTPQAAAWARESWRWLTVAMWVRTYVICEGAEATAADKSSLHRFADQIGLTPAGLKENGWQVASEPSGVPRERAGVSVDPAPRRMRVVNGGA